MGKTSSAVKNKYRAKAYDQMLVLVKKGEKVKISEHAKAQGLSVNAYIKKLISDDMGGLDL